MLFCLLSPASGGDWCPPTGQWFLMRCLLPCSTPHSIGRSKTRGGDTTHSSRSSTPRWSLSRHHSRFSPACDSLRSGPPVDGSPALCPNGWPAPSTTRFCCSLSDSPSSPCARVRRCGRVYRLCHRGGRDGRCVGCREARTSEAHSSHNGQGSGVATTCPARSCV